MREPWRDYCIRFEGSGRHRYADMRMRLHRVLGAAAWLCIGRWDLISSSMMD